MRLVPSNMFKLSCHSFTDHSEVMLFVDPSCYLCFMCVCHIIWYVPYSLMVTCWEKADLLDLLYVMLSCVCIAFQYGVPGQVQY